MQSGGNFPASPRRYIFIVNSILRPWYGRVFGLAASVTSTSANLRVPCGKNETKSWPHGAREGTEKRKELIQKS